MRQAAARRGERQRLRPLRKRDHARMARAVKLDVYGNRMLVERADGAWHAYLLGTDGKRSRVDVAVPASLTEEELVQYFDDVYHEAATARHPAVVRIA